ncbi:MAG: hypothetical protein M0Z40_12785 [Actinomycetota bacterium]|nr:hypothetical protein [Actinomycetota bacterium]
MSGAGRAMAQASTARVRRASLGGRARTLLACAALAVSALGLGGCAAAREELGTAASGCFVDLALASHAVHDRGRLRGVRLVSVTSLGAHAPLLFNAAEVDGRRLAQVCLVAFGGEFVARGVAHPIGAPSGDLAVVELGFPGRRLLATLLVTRPPLPFGHYHI